MRKNEEKNGDEVLFVMDSDIPTDVTFRLSTDRHMSFSIPERQKIHHLSKSMITSQSYFRFGYVSKRYQNLLVAVAASCTLHAAHCPQHVYTGNY
jgi:hypothetical protein